MYQIDQPSGEIFSHLFSNLFISVFGKTWHKYWMKQSHLSTSIPPLVFYFHISNCFIKKRFKNFLCKNSSAELKMAQTDVYLVTHFEMIAILKWFVVAHMLTIFHFYCTTISKISHVTLCNLSKWRYWIIDSSKCYFFHK